MSLEEKELRRKWLQQVVLQAIAEHPDMTKEELSRRFGVSPAALGKWIKGLVDPNQCTMEVWESWADFFGLDVKTLQSQRDRYAASMGKHRPVDRSLSGDQIYSAILSGGRDTQTLAAKALVVVLSKPEAVEKAALLLSSTETDIKVDDIFQIFRDAIANARIVSIPEAIQQIMREERSPTVSDIYWLCENTSPVNDLGEPLDSDDLTRIAGIDTNGEQKKRPQNGDMPNGDASHSR